MTIKPIKTKDTTQKKLTSSSDTKRSTDSYKDKKKKLKKAKEKLKLLASWPEAIIVAVGIEGTKQAIKRSIEYEREHPGAAAKASEKQAKAHPVHQSTSDPTTAGTHVTSSGQILYK